MSVKAEFSPVRSVGGGGGGLGGRGETRKTSVLERRSTFEAKEVRVIPGVSTIVFSAIEVVWTEQLSLVKTSAVLPHF